MADVLGVENFGSGRMFLIEGDAVGTTEEIGLLRDVSIEFKGTKKPLKAGQKYARRTAITDQSIEGKASSALFSGKLLAAILGATPAAGKHETTAEVVTAAATVTPTHSGTYFAEPLTVLDKDDQVMDKVAGTPAVGQYAVNTTNGVLTLNASETGSLTYTYRYHVTTGNSFTIANSVVSAPTRFRMVLFENYIGQSYSLTLNAITIDSWSLNEKAEDWADCSISFSAEPDSSGNIGTIDYEDN